MSKSAEPMITPDSGAKPEGFSHSPLITFLGLLIAFSFPYVLSVIGPRTLTLTDVHGDRVNVLAKWVAVFVLCVIAFGLQRRRPADLGIRSFDWRDALAAIAGTLTALVLSGMASHVVSLPSSLSDLKTLVAVPMSLRVALVLTAAFSEEFIYRGFGIEELALLTRNRWLAAAISLIFFTLAHVRLYGFSTALIVPGLTGAVLTLLYL